MLTQIVPGSPVQQGTTARRRILVVDDDALLRDVLCDVLVSRGYVVERAANGKEALECLSSSAVLPGLILLDVMMPVMDGYAFRTAQRGDPKIAHIGVIVMTADAQIKATDAQLKAIAVLHKPFDLELLLRTLLKNYPLGWGAPTVKR